jgi:hypothetical protein
MPSCSGPLVALTCAHPWKHVTQAGFPAPADRLRCVCAFACDPHWWWAVAPPPGETTGALMLVPNLHSQHCCTIACLGGALGPAPTRAGAQGLCCTLEAFAAPSTLPYAATALCSMQCRICCNPMQGPHGILGWRAMLGDQRKPCMHLVGWPFTSMRLSALGWQGNGPAGASGVLCMSCNASCCPLTHHAAHVPVLPNSVGAGAGEAGPSGELVH